MTYTFNSQSVLLQRQADTKLASSHGENDHAVATVPRWDANQEFIAMLNGYRRSGGLAQAREVASMCNSAKTCSCSLAQLADGIVKRDLISVGWQSRIWVPLFQFNRADMSLRDGLRNVLAELVVVFNAWDLALWFSQPNPWLINSTPADITALSIQDVMHAARAERYVAAG